ncbi:MAG: DUF5694 domain-containing protein [Pseudomonadota bacterium]
MKWVQSAIGVLAVVSASLVAAEEPLDQSAPTDDPVKPIQVMILGTYHFANPGQDLVNVEVDDMLAPKRQKELEQLATSLAEWAPTKIAVENEASAPSFEMEGYSRAIELMTSSRNETVQVGYRLALKLGHDAVYGYDERGGEGEPDYFPMGKVQAAAEANGQMPILTKLIAEVRAGADDYEDDLADISVAKSLITHNDGAKLAAQHDKLYYALIPIGDGDNQAGAELNAYWYMRNAKMFGKIDMIAEPGDRVLVIAGSGHATWLRHFAERMPGYELVETIPYLEAAASAADQTEP